MKEKQLIPRREKWEKIWIYMINYWKKNKEYYLAQEYSNAFFLGNPWNPFKQFHILDYDIYSDDIEGRLEVIDSEPSEISSDNELPDDFLEMDENDRPIWNTNPERTWFANMFDLTFIPTNKFVTNLESKPEY